ncbi:hypothetical protein HK098_002323 [Nowakowskiella sp. JEL0407]|nr:hypothetical protein HK098_002323 [Nowakowskiella sp. JEL0407]
MSELSGCWLYSKPALIINFGVALFTAVFTYHSLGRRPGTWLMQICFLVGGIALAAFGMYREFKDALCPHGLMIIQKMYAVTTLIVNCFAFIIYVIELTDLDKPTPLNRVEPNELEQGSGAITRKETVREKFAESDLASSFFGVIITMVLILSIVYIAITVALLADAPYKPIYGASVGAALAIMVLIACGFSCFSFSIVWCVSSIRLNMVDCCFQMPTVPATSSALVILFTAFKMAILATILVSYFNTLHSGYLVQTSWPWLAASKAAGGLAAVLNLAFSC